MIGFDPIINERLCMTLLHSLWQMALLAMLAGGMRLLLKRKRDQISYLIHSGALILGLVALPLTYSLLASKTPVLANDTQIVTTVAQSPATTLLEPLSLDASPMQLVTADNTDPATSPLSRSDSQAEAAPETTANSWQQFAPWLVVVYLIGVLTMLIRLASSAFRVEQIRSTAIAIKDGSVFESLRKLSDSWSLKAAPALAHGEQVIVPKVVGLLKPTILLPTSALTGMQPEALELILAHELAHVRRLDLWVNLLQRLAESALFFNPAMWWLSRQTSMLREYCCDDQACSTMTASITDTDEPELRYAQALLQCVQLNSGKQIQHASALAASGSSPSELRRRVARLFGEPLREPFRLSRGGSLSLLLGIIVLTSSWAWAKKTISEDNKEATRQLHSAVIQDPDRIEGLIKKGADVDDVDSRGTTPLWKAVRHSKLASVKTLITAGADPDIARKTDGWTPLHCNAFYNRREVAIQIAKQLIKSDANVNQTSLKDGETALHYAVRATKSAELTELLLNAGAKINHRSSKGDTPLQFAVSGGSKELVDLLLTKGANPAQRNHLGIRPIDQINAIAETEAKKVQAVFQSHGFDSERRPRLFKSYVHDPKKATVAGKFVLEDGSTAKVKAQMYYDTWLDNSTGISGTQEQYTNAFSFQVHAGTTWLTCYADGFAPAWTEKFKLGSEASNDDLEIVFHKGVSQVLRVVNENGDPIAGATLVEHPEIHGQWSGPIYPKKTDERGEYVLNHLANVRYGFNIEADGYEALSEKHQLDPERSLTLKMTTAAKTTGTVVGENGQALVGASIRVKHESKEQGDRRFSDSRKSSWWGEEYGVTDSEGRFTLNRLTRGARYLVIAEAADGARAIIHSIKTGRDTEIIMPPRRDLIIEFEGDIGSLKRGNWKPRVEVRQRVRFETTPKEIVGELLGGSAEIQETPGGGRAIYRGLGVDLNSTLEQQKVAVYLPGHSEHPTQVVNINPHGDTLVKFVLKEKEPNDSPKAESEKPVGTKMPD